MGLLNNYADINTEEEAAKLRALVALLNKDEESEKEEEKDD